MFKKSRIGVTLIELILVIALIGIIGSIPISMYLVGQKAHASTSREFIIQSNLRLTAQKLTNSIRSASAIFLFRADGVPNTHSIKPFRDNTLFGSVNNIVKLDAAFLVGKSALASAIEQFKGWSFLILNEDKTELREFKWNITGTTYTDGHYTMSRVIDKQDNPKMIYDITYEKVNPYYDDSLISYKIVGNVAGASPSNERIIESQLEALNSLQVIDKGKETIPTVVSTTIFYRSDKRPLPKDNEAVISMVLDESGSMGYNMAGTIMGGTPTRLSILKVQAKSMINKFGTSGLGITNINIVPFDYHANLRKDIPGLNNFLNASVLKDRTDLGNIIDDLSALDGTNAGDGLRRAYHKLLDYNKTPANRNKNKYIILLMDGVPTNYSWRSSTFIVDDSAVGSGERKGLGSSYDSTALQYIEKISELFVNIKNSSGTTNLKVFIIGFSGKPDDLEKLGLVEDAIRDSGKVTTKKWIATNDGDLNAVFNEIRNIIIDETWHINGPKWTVN